MIVHIYNRGVDKRKTFQTERDYEKFIEYLYLCNSDVNIRYNNLYRYDKYKKNIFNYEIKKRLVNIGAWCLMPNHFHLLIDFKKEEDLSRFMQKISIAYTLYFNKKHKRVGHLFSGAYKLKHINSDEYYDKVWSYIHLNPLVLFPNNNGEVLQKYSYSSLIDYINLNNITSKPMKETKKNNNERNENKILNLENFPNVKFKDIKTMKAISENVELDD